MANRFWPPPLLRAPEPKLEERSQQVFPWGPWGDTYSQSTAGVNVSPDSALQLLTVFGCVSLISDTIATLPRHVYRDVGEDAMTEVTNTPRWFENPNPNTDIIEFITQSCTSLLLDGNCYWAYGIDRNGLATELYVLDPTKVDVRERGRVLGDAPSIGNGRVVEYFVNGNRFAGRMLHIKGITRPGSLKGMSPVEAARQSIGLGLATQAFAASFYQNGITPSGLVSTDADLTQDQAREIAQALSRTHAGAKSSHLPLVLDNGATWTQLSVTPEQAQFLATREFQAGEICAQMFLVDPSMLGIAINRGQNLTYANLADRGTHLVQYTLMRWLVRLERAFSTLLPKPHYMKFNVDGIQRADLAARTTAYRTALGSNVPWMSVNEVRDLEEMPPIPGQDSLAEPAQPPAQTNPFMPQPPNGNGATVGAPNGPH